MEIRILGPVEAVIDGRPIAIKGPKACTLLAILAMYTDRTVSLDELVDALWDEDPPEQARSSLYTHISALRRAIAGGAASLRRSSGGYQLAAPEDQVDLHVFTRDAAAGRAALADGDLEEAASRLTAALALWRGPALGGARGTWAEGERARLRQSQLTALEDWAEAHLAMERGEAVIPALTAAVGEHPLRERLRGQLMLALHHTGRQAEALACYHEGRQALLEDLGVDPGPALRSVHERILRTEPKSPARVPAETASRPSQLPRNIADFTGRTAQAGHLVRQLTETSDTLRVCAVFGQPGAGKSTLTTHVAHAVRTHFRDGQLYANLRGVHAVPADTGEVLAGFLRALGVAKTAIPDDTDERARLYRSLLAERRVLVLLDDARDERQVRPLLPGGNSCAVLVSSRERMGALDGAVHTHLPVLDDDEALELLNRVVGDERVAAEPRAAEEIVRLCGQLPLAVRIAGARLAARPQWQLSRLAERLRVQCRTLQELTLGDLEVRSSLAFSYDGLARRERTALRRLGLLDVSTFGGWLVAPLLGCSPTDAEEIVERLVDAQLVTLIGEEGGFLRYRLHDLTRVFARQQGEAEETEDEVLAACTRAAQTCLALTELAGRSIPHAGFDQPTRADTDPFVDDCAVTELLADPEAWFDAEQTTLIGIVERISELNLTDMATRLAAGLCASHFSVRNQFTQWWRTHAAALAAARRAGDRAGEARLLSGLGWLRYEQDRFDEAQTYYDQAIKAFRDSGDRHGEATTLLSLSTVQRERGELARARSSIDSALPWLEQPAHIAQAAHGLGRVLTEQGELEQALSECVHALQLYRRLGDRRGEAITLRSVSIVHRAAGRLTEAAEHAEAAVGILHDLGDRLMYAYAIQALAKVRIRQGLGDTMRHELLECLRTCNEMQDGFGQALTLRTLGELDLATGRPQHAIDHLNRSLQWWTALDLPTWQTRTLRDLTTARAELARSGRTANTRPETNEPREGTSFTTRQPGCR
ncbi:AfsR/SARP family transcriptional regulator [Streptomyces minutiscleroticus]|nr:AfsR/SARP family transcriptional regulator [Streptomyces minutiscleroticus]